MERMISLLFLLSVFGSCSVECLPTPCKRAPKAVIDFRPAVDKHRSYTILPTMERYSLEELKFPCGESFELDGTNEAETFQQAITDAVEQVDILRSRILSVIKEEFHFKSYLLYNHSRQCPSEMMLKGGQNSTAVMSILTQYAVQYSVHMGNSEFCGYINSTNVMAVDQQFESLQDVLGLLCFGETMGWKADPTSLEGAEGKECMDRDYQIVNLLYCLAYGFLPALSDFVGVEY